MSTTKTNTSIIAPPCDNHQEILKLFESPKLIGLIGDANSGKSNVLYWTIKALRENYNFKLYYFGLRAKVAGAIQIFSVEELEVIQDSVIIIDEFASMFDLDDRKQKKQIENTLRLIFHNNNVILLAGLPENFKKFIASKLNAMIFTQCALGDFINGSRAKKVTTNYGGSERGAAMLAMKVGEAIIYNGIHYHKVIVPLIPEGNTKATNGNILQKRG